MRRPHGSPERREGPDPERLRALTAEPGPIDIYPDPWVDAGAKPLISIPYGTVSDYFDPTVADEQGDMFLSAYRSGETGNGNALADQTETLKVARS